MGERILTICDRLCKAPAVSTPTDSSALLCSAPLLWLLPSSSTIAMSTALTPAASSTSASRRAGSTTSASAAVAVNYAHADIGLAPNNWLQARLQAAEKEQQRAQRKTDAKIEKLIRSKVVDLGVPAMRTNAAVAAAAAQSPSLSTPAAATPALATEYPDLFSSGAALLASLTGQVVATTHRSSICSSMNQRSSKVMISHTRVKIKGSKEAAAAAAAATAAASAQAAVAPAAAATAASVAPTFGAFTAARRSTNRVAPGVAAAAASRASIPQSNSIAANAASKHAVLPATAPGSGGRKRSSEAATAAGATALAPPAAASPKVRGSGGSAKKRKLGDAPVAGATPLGHSARLTLGSPGLGSLLMTPQAAEKEIRIEETPMQSGGSGATGSHGRTPLTGASKTAGGSAQPVGFRVRKKLFGSPDQKARHPATSAGSATSFAMRLLPATNAAAAAGTALSLSPASSHRSPFVGATPSPASSRRTPGQSGTSSQAMLLQASPSLSPTVATRLGKHHSVKRPLQFDDPAPLVAADAEMKPAGKKARYGEKASTTDPLFSIKSSLSNAVPHRALSIVPEVAMQEELKEEAAAAENELDQPRKPAAQRNPRRKNTSRAAPAASVVTPRETRSLRSRQ